MLPDDVSQLVDHVRRLIQAKEQEIADLEERHLAGPRRDLETLRRMLPYHDAKAPPERSQADIDADIVRALRERGLPMRATDIAQVVDIDARAISPRLPRMVRDGLIIGNKDRGYTVDE